MNGVRTGFIQVTFVLCALRLLARCRKRLTKLLLILVKAFWTCSERLLAVDPFKYSNIT